MDIAVMVTESARSALKMEHHLMCNCVQRNTQLRLLRCEIVVGEYNCRIQKSKTKRKHKRAEQKLLLTNWNNSHQEN